MRQTNSGVTLGDIARETGLSRATVSRSLRNNPQIPEATRTRVQRAAEELGYRPDPETSRLMGYLKKAQEQRFQSTIGVINDLPDLHGGKRKTSGSDYVSQMLDGATKRAEDLGFVLDEIYLGQPKMTGKRLNQILRSRAIRGVLLPPETDPLPNIDLDWASLSAVATTTMRQPDNIHRVLPNNFLNTQKIMRHVYEQGYRRIGLITQEDLEKRMYGAPTSQYLWATSTFPDLKPFPIFEWSGFDQPENRIRDLLKWFSTCKPEVIVGCGAWLLPAIDEHVGCRCPQDFAYINYAEPSPGVAGLDQQPGVIGAAAVDFISAHITRGEVGLPENPKLMLIEGKLVPGDSCPPARQ